MNDHSVHEGAVICHLNIIAGRLVCARRRCLFSVGLPEDPLDTPELGPVRNVTRRVC